MSNNWRASGRRQLRICISMYDNDILSERDYFTQTHNYLRRSSDIIREHAAPNSPEMTDGVSPKNLIDVEIRLAQFANGAEFRHVEFTSRDANRFRPTGRNL